MAHEACGGRPDRFRAMVLAPIRYTSQTLKPPAAIFATSRAVRTWFAQALGRQYGAYLSTETDAEHILPETIPFAKRDRATGDMTSSEPLKLLVDAMLGRLTKWLRLAGYDAESGGGLPDHELARRARAEARALVTRDPALASRRGLRTLLIRSETLEDQLREVKESLGPPPGSPFSRCSVCNGLLEGADPDQVADLVPPYVLRTQNKFRLCPSCHRVYWSGTHSQGIRSRIAIFADE